MVVAAAMSGDSLVHFLFPPYLDTLGLPVDLIGFLMAPLSTQLSLDYLQGMGVDCIWLLPVFDTPDRDNALAFQFGQDPDVANRGMQAWPLSLMGFSERALARGISLDAALSVSHPALVPMRIELRALSPLLDALVHPVLEALGIGLGVADVRMGDRPVCNGIKLVG